MLANKPFVRDRSATYRVRSIRAEQEITQGFSSTSQEGERREEAIYRPPTTGYVFCICYLINIQINPSRYYQPHFYK